MTALALNLAGPIREALVSDPTISAYLTLWDGEPAVFARRPVPDGAQYPFIAISPDVSITDQDALVSRRPVILRDVTVYGENPDQYRDTEDCAYLVRAFFHRQRFAISVPGYSVTEIVASGPIPAPVDDERHVARVVTLRLRLLDLAS